MTSDDPLLDDVADAILDGTAIDWDQVEARVGVDRLLLDGLRELAAVANTHRDIPSPARWGHLTLIEPLGRGAFGRVFRALDTRLNREVALKLLEAPSRCGNARASSIVDEGRRLAQVRHPNVVTIHGAARIGDEVGLWMELVQGRTLQQLLDQGRRFTAAEAIDIGSQICDAVAAVHDAGLLHRDIKAANVMLSDTGRVVLMDFGTGWEARDSSHAVPAGTPLYLAPELLEGGEPTVGTDIYAIGVLLFYLLTGRYPVTAVAIDELKSAHASQVRVDLRALRPDVPRALAAVVERSIAQLSEHRYETAAAMTAELRQANRRVPKSLVAAGTILAVVAGALLAAEAFRSSERSSPASPANETLTAAILASAPGEKWDPALSRDGSRVAYMRSRYSVWEIHVTDLSSNRTWRVTKIDETGAYPRWAPDGLSLAFYRSVPSDEGPQLAVSLVPLDGGEPRTLWRTGRHVVGAGLSWSPDGRQLALSAKPSIGRPFRIMLLDVSTLSRQWLTDPDSVEGDTLPAFSPDGASLAFVRSAGPESALHVIQLESGEIRRLDVGRHDVGDMTWSDEGRSLIFTSLRAGGRDTLWRIPSSGGEPQPVAGLGEGARFPSAAGGRLVYLQQVVDSNLYRAELPGGAAVGPKRLTSSMRVDASPDISPDGLRIAFTSNRSGSSEVWLADADGANPKRLTALGATTHPRWSPNGRYLTCAVGSTVSASSIQVIDMSSGASRRLTDGVALEKWPTWAADGQSIYFASFRSGSWQIWKVKVAGGDPVQITHNGGLKAWESSDGSAVYYSSESGGERAIWRMPVRGGEPTLVLPFPPRTHWGGEWILKPDGIYWVNVGGSPLAIEWLSFATGRSVPVIVPKGPYAHGSGFSVSNDGRWIVFSGMDYHGTEIMMLETSRSR